MKKISMFLTVVLCMSLFLLLPVYANDCSLGRSAEGVYMISDSEIQMVSEDIKVYVLDGCADCTFEFHNLGEATEILMGFPASMKTDADEANMDPENMKLSDFTANDENGSIEVTLEETVPGYDDTDYATWYTFKVKFEKDETKIIHNTYTFTNTVYSIGDIKTGYIIDTGAAWKDKIEHSKVTFFMPGIELYQINELIGEPYFSWENGEMIWERYDYEPTENIAMIIATSLTEDGLKKIGDGEYKDELIKNKEELKALEKAIDTMDKNTIINKLFNTRIYDLLDGLRLKGLKRYSELTLTDKLIVMQIDSMRTFSNIDEVDLDVAPRITDGRTLIPLRFIVENMGGDIQWDAEKKQVLINNEGKTIIMNIGDKKITENGVEKEIEVAPEIVDGRTLVPIRFIAESMGFDVEWYAENQLISISK